MNCTESKLYKLEEITRFLIECYNKQKDADVVFRIDENKKLTIFTDGEKYENIVIKKF